MSQLESDAAAGFEIGQEFQRFSTTDHNPQSFVRLSRSPFPQSERRNNTRKMVSFAQPPDVLLNSVILT